MPIPDHRDIDRLTSQLIRLYELAEASLYGQMARRIKVGINDPEWETIQQRQLSELRRDVNRTAAALSTWTAAEIPGLVSDLSARVDVIVSGELDAPLAPIGDRGESAAVLAIRETLTPVGIRMAATTVTAYQAVIGAALAGADGIARRKAAQRALNTFAGKGVTGFRDRRGRNWDMTSYVEMASRTIMADHALGQQAKRLTAAGMDLVIVSDAPQECKLCRPYEGKVLSITGQNTGTVEVPSVTTGEPVTVNVMTSVARAMAAGLFHPNCRHSRSAYLPGVTKRPTNTADVEGDAARSKLRYLERQKRAWRRREAVALDETDRARARSAAMSYTQRIKEHVANTTAKRQPHRESITAAR